MTTILSTWKRPGEVAIRAAWNARTSGADLLSCLEKGLAAAELDPTLIAIGLGSVPNSEGVLELDASIMDGANFRSGAVCAMCDIVPAISVAKLVMDKTSHCMLAGDAARQFALEHGFEPTELNTEDSIARYQEWLSTQPDVATYVHASEEKMGDTVTMLALEAPTHCVAASSTSGLPFKLPGRVGDSPIIGAGIYADDAVGSAGATGNGEALWRNVTSFRVINLMERGMSAQEACEAAMRHLAKTQPDQLHLPSAAFALRRDGDIGAAVIGGDSPFEVWICRDGEIEMIERFPLEQ